MAGSPALSCAVLGSALRVLARVVLAAAALAVAVLYGRRAGLLALAGLLGIFLLLGWWLPRAAHRAFRKGRYQRSRTLYKLLRLWVVSPASRSAIDVSLAACALAMEDWPRALAELDRVDQAYLCDAARAAWLNNRAYALARGGHDPEAALACSDQAIALRPDVAGFRHTRGVALLQLGRLDEAIAELERLWDELSGQPGEEVPLLEAERCYDLGLAWKRKGEGDYAADYFHRAHRASPGSRWAERAARNLDTRPTARTLPGLAELLDA